MDGPIDPTPSHQGRVGSIDDGVDLQTSDVSAPQGHLAGESGVGREAGCSRSGVGAWGGRDGGTHKHAGSWRTQMNAAVCCRSIAALCSRWVLQQGQMSRTTWSAT